MSRTTRVDGLAAGESFGCRLGYGQQAECSCLCFIARQSVFFVLLIVYLKNKLDWFVRLYWGFDWGFVATYLRLQVSVDYVVYIVREFLM